MVTYKGSKQHGITRKETMAFTYEQYPQVKRALIALAYDNGMVDRDNPIEDQLAKWLIEIPNQPEARITATESYVATLTDDILEKVIGGEETETAELMAATTDPVTAALVDQFLKDMFEVC